MAVIKQERVSMKTGKTKIQFALKNVYSVLSAGVNKYYMVYEGKEINIEDYLEQNK